MSRWTDKQIEVVKIIFTFQREMGGWADRQTEKSKWLEKLTDDRQTDI
jgi:hypothetical protein